MLTMLRNGGAGDENIRKLMGHQGSSVAARYGKFEPKMLKDELHKIAIPEAIKNIPHRL